MVVFENNGQGSFMAVQTFNPGGDLHWLEAADFNGDGVDEFVVADTAGNTFKFVTYLANTETTTRVNRVTQLSGMDVSTRTNALTTLTAAQENLSLLNNIASTFGASTSRLETARSNLESARASYEGAASRIQDLDVAEEAANLVRRNILQQAGAAVLAQANLQPSLVLRLLGS